MFSQVIMNRTRNSEFIQNPFPVECRNNVFQRVSLQSTDPLPLRLPYISAIILRFILLSCQIAGESSAVMMNVLIVAKCWMLLVRLWQIAINEEGKFCERKLGILCRPFHLLFPIHFGLLDRIYCPRLGICVPQILVLRWILLNSLPFPICPDQPITD